jgi:hypothetical protein
MRVLYSSGELHDSIKEVLAAPQLGDRRVALVAFVGGSAQAFLPDPDGLEIVCWLQPGATDALTLERLKRRGAKLFKSDRLHMKVYWSSRRSCVICSANASGQALGGGNQKEAGVWLPPDVVDIARLWHEASPEPVEDDDLGRLAIEGEHASRRGGGGVAAPCADFREWRSLPWRRGWKLGAWTHDADFAQNALKRSARAHGVTRPNYLIDTKKGQARPQDWLLMFNSPAVAYVRWLYVDFVVEVPRTDEAYVNGYPFQAVQIHKPKLCPTPPFRIDPFFKAALRRAVKGYGIQEVDELEVAAPPEDLLNRIAKELDASERAAESRHDGASKALAAAKRRPPRLS